MYGHVILVSVATQMIPPANHPVPPAKVYSIGNSVFEALQS